MVNVVLVFFGLVSIASALAVFAASAIYRRHLAVAITEGAILLIGGAVALTAVFHQAVRGHVAIPLAAVILGNALFLRIIARRYGSSRV